MYQNMSADTNLLYADIRVSERADFERYAMQRRATVVLWQVARVPQMV